MRQSGGDQGPPICWQTRSKACLVDNVASLGQAMTANGVDAAWIQELQDEGPEGLRISAADLFLSWA